MLSESRDSLSLTVSGNTLDTVRLTFERKRFSYHSVTGVIMLRSELLFPGRLRQIPRKPHPKWLKNIPHGVLIERLSGHPLHHRSQSDEVNISVGESRPRWLLRGFGKRHAE